MYIGLHHLAPDAVSRLRNEKTFMHFDDIEFEPQSPSAVYTLFGFPEAWSSPSTSEEEKVKYKTLQYTTYRYDRSTSSFSEYQERFHLLLDGQLCQAFDNNVSAIQPSDLDGNPTSINNNLSGISGCSIWRIGDFKKPTSKWDIERSKLVAVQTGVYYGVRAIKATRWIAISTLIHKVFPELRPAMELWHL